MTPISKKTIKGLLIKAGRILPPGFMRLALPKIPSRLSYLLDLRDLYPRNDCLPPELWDMSSGPDGHLMIQGHDCVSLAKQYGTPLFVVDKKRLEKNYLNFYNSFQERYPRIEIAYSYKTNPLPGVIKALHEFGASAEVVSHFELWLAFKLGVPPEEIIYNGSGKTEESLRMAVSNNIKLINISDEEEIEVINSLAMTLGHKQQVGVRVVSSEGWKTKFGFNIESGDAYRIFASLKEFNELIPCGLHIHLGTGISNIDNYLKAIKEVLELSILVREKLNITIKYFDFGGGFSVPTMNKFDNQDRTLLSYGLPAKPIKVPTCPPMSKYASAIIELFNQYYSPELDEPPTIIFEPGRAITSSAQSLLMKVLTVRPPENGMESLILDGGTNSAAPLGWSQRHELFHTSKMNTPISNCKYYRVYGPLCQPDDILCYVKDLPLVECGDILAIMDAGAYFVPSQTNFSFPRASAVLLENGYQELIRERESFDDMVARDFLDIKND